MTATQTPPTPRTHTEPADRPARTRVGRGAVIIVLIVSLLATMGSRYLADQQKRRVLTNNGRVPLPAATGASNLAAMNSFALALLLGGLRGPLVMILWQNSESQKQEKNLETFDTQVEWIRMLQPEFDSVHIFQMWNKGYNISVQKASNENKYITILDAIQYGYSVDEERPHNINIMAAIGQLYFDKFGTSQEKEYYRPRVRSDSLHREVKEQRRGETVRNVRLEPRLTPEGTIRAEYLEGNLPRPETLPADKPWNTGADLQYLKQFEPFPFGISPFAFAYNYYKRAQVLQESAGQTHAQLSDSVIDSRPALALKNWAEEEWERGRKIEAGLLRVRPYSEDEQTRQRPFGQDILEPRAQLELLTIPLRPADQPLQADNLPELVFSYQRAAELAEAAIREYERHLASSEFSINISTYQSHMDHLRAVRAIALADKAYVQGLMASPGAERQKHFEEAAGLYRDAIAQNELTQLRYFTDGALLKEFNADRETLRDMTAEQRHALMQQVRAAFAGGAMDINREDRIEYERYVTRAQSRLELMGMQ
jgi:hypothetical protein